MIKLTPKILEQIKKSGIPIIEITLDDLKKSSIIKNIKPKIKKS